MSRVGSKCTKPHVMLEEVVHERHDFLQKTVQRLRDRAGNVCSFPECHVNTHGSAFTGDKAVGVGVACHIKAAAPGGPRYDAKQTKDERRHLSNGIWMCQTHSKLVDADDSAYSIETLLEWKQKAEARSNSLINQKSFTENEVRAAVEAGAVSILQRWVNKSNDPFDTPIAEVMTGYEAGLRALDPRFNVQVDKVGGHYNHIISAAQDKVSLQLILQDLDKLEGYWDAERALYEEGRQLEIPGAHFKFEGSKLFDAIHRRTHRSEQGTLTLGAPRKALTANLYVRTPKGHESVVDSFTCYYTSGSLRTVFEGAALDGFFTVKASCTHDGKGTKFDLKFNVDAWRGKNILDLPRFFRLAKVAPLLASGRLVVEIEVGNNVASFDTKFSPINEQYHAQLRWLIEYLDFARKVAEQCSETIFLKEVEFDSEVYTALRRYSRLLAGPIISTRKSGWLCGGEFTFDERGQFSDFLSKDLPPLIKLVQNNNMTFNLFGQAVSAPRIETIYTGMEVFLFSDLEAPTKPKIELHTTEETTITTLFHAEDSWIVHEDLSIFDESMPPSN
ncbi:HNH endonuclease [Pseudomonas syringae]|nr:HNH endonuclease [Pseudomonas syringae]